MVCILGSGSTFVNIGQNYLDEWNSFASGVKTPAGISVYGNIYDGALNSDSQTLLASYAQSRRLSRLMPKNLLC